MTRRTSTRAERREQIARLLTEDPALSNREAARRASSDHKTAARIRAELERAGAIPVRTLRVQEHGGALMEPAALGNLRAVKSGVDSDVKLAPLRIEGEAWARDRWQWLDDARVALVADLMARTELARRWTEAQGTVVRNKAGEVFPVVDRLDRWSARLDDLIVRLDREALERGKVDPVAELAALAAEFEAEAS